MEIKIPKEVRDYHENIFFGLNTRQFICSVLAVGGNLGIPAAMIFVANQKGSHNPNEAMEITDFIQGAEALWHAVKAFPVEGIR